MDDQISLSAVRAARAGSQAAAAAAATVVKPELCSETTPLAQFCRLLQGVSVCTSAALSPATR